MRQRKAIKIVAMSTLLRRVQTGNYLTRYQRRGL
jgi:hypothetical protein